MSAKTKAQLWFALAIFLLLAGCQKQQAPTIEQRPDLAAFFQEEQVDGTFVLYDVQENRTLIYNEERANQPFIPASTFKVFNALVSLETAVIADEDEIIPWDGTQYDVESWNQDHNLRTAIRDSAVWFYQEMARRIGAEKMQHYVELAGYGNQITGGEIDNFWLEGDIRITPTQQVQFLTRLVNDELPFSQRAMDIVKDILILEERDGTILRGKTGWGLRFTPQVGWFVGYLEREGNYYVFATQIDIHTPEDALARRAITEQILQHLDLLNEGQ